MLSGPKPYEVEVTGIGGETNVSPLREQSMLLMVLACSQSCLYACPPLSSWRLMPSKSGERAPIRVVLCPFFFGEAGRIGFYSSCLPSEGETCCKTGSILPRGRDTLPLLSSLLLPPLREGGKFVRSIDGGLWDDEGLFSSSSPESVDSTNLLLFLRRALRDALGGSETVGEGRQARSCFISPLSQLFSARSSSICLESRSMSPSPRIILARVAMTFVAALTRITDSCNFFTRLPLSPLEHLAMLKMVTERSISR